MKNHLTLVIFSFVFLLNFPSVSHAQSGQKTLSSNSNKFRCDDEFLDRITVNVSNALCAGSSMLGCMIGPGLGVSAVGLWALGESVKGDHSYRALAEIEKHYRKMAIGGYAGTAGESELEKSRTIRKVLDDPTRATIKSALQAFGDPADSHALAAIKAFRSDLRFIAATKAAGVTLGLGALSFIVWGVSPIIDAKPLACSEIVQGYYETDSQCNPVPKIGKKVVSFLGLNRSEQRAVVERYPDVCKNLKNLDDDLAKVPEIKVKFSKLTCIPETTVTVEDEKGNKSVHQISFGDDRNIKTISIGPEASPLTGSNVEPIKLNFVGSGQETRLVSIGLKSALSVDRNLTVSDYLQLFKEDPRRYGRIWQGVDFARRYMPEVVTCCAQPEKPKGCDLLMATSDDKDKPATQPLVK